jgi:hypothetical protein
VRVGARRIPVGDVVAGDVVQLVTEREHLTDVIEMVAHQAGIDLVRRFTLHYHCADDEARTLVQSALASAGDIAVTVIDLRATSAAQLATSDRRPRRALRRPRRALRRPRRARPAGPRHVVHDGEPADSPGLRWRCPAAPLVRQRRPAVELTLVRDETRASRDVQNALAGSAAPRDRWSPCSMLRRGQPFVGQRRSASRISSSTATSGPTWNQASSTAARAIAGFQPRPTSASRACIGTSSSAPGFDEGSLRRRTWSWPAAVVAIASVPR